jgi:Family of unknown function (DUF6356)
MMELMRRFHEHPRSVGESYAQHAIHAARFGCSMLVGSLACFVHAAFPWVCTTTGSQTVVRLHQRMVINRSRNRLDEMRPLNPLDCLAENI